MKKIVWLTHYLHLVCRKLLPSLVHWWVSLCHACRISWESFIISVLPGKYWYYAHLFLLLHINVSFLFGFCKGCYASMLVTVVFLSFFGRGPPVIFWFPIYELSQRENQVKVTAKFVNISLSSVGIFDYCSIKPFGTLDTFLPLYGVVFQKVWCMYPFPSSKKIILCYPALTNIFPFCRIVGMAGIWQSLVLVSFCGACTFLTGLSLSAIATNGAMKVCWTFVLLVTCLCNGVNTWYALLLLVHLFHFVWGTWFQIWSNSICMVIVDLDLLLGILWKLAWCAMLLPR